MINKKNQHYQVKPSKRYNDEFATGNELKSNAISLEDDLNAIRTQIRRITGRENWYDDSNFPSRTDLAFLFESSQKTWSTIFSDSGSVSPDKRQDTFTFTAGYGVETQIIGKEIFIKPAAKYYSVYTNGSNSTSPSSSLGTLSILGEGSNITTTAEEVNGEKRIIVDYSGPGRQDIWYRIYDDDGGSIVPTLSPDILEFVGQNSLTASISGKTLTLSYPQDLSDGATPTFANIKIGSLEDNGIIFIDNDNFLVNDPVNLYYNPLDNKVGIRTSSPEQNIHIQDGNFYHSREESVSFVNSISSNEFSKVNFIKYHKGFLYFTTLGNSDNRFYSISVIDETNPHISDYITIDKVSGGSSIGGFEIAGKYAYVPKETTLYVIDIENPYNLTEVGFLELSSSHLQFCIIFGNTLLCFESNASIPTGTKIHVVDIGNPKKPSLLYTDTSLVNHHKVTSGIIRGNRLYISGLSSGTGISSIFDLTDIQTNINFASSRIINSLVNIYGSNAFRRMYSVGNSIYITDLSRDFIVHEIIGNISGIEYDLGEASGVYHGLIPGGQNSFYLLRDDEILTIERDSISSISLKGTYTEPNGYEPKCGDFSGNRLYVYHENFPGGLISIYENASDSGPFFESQRTTTDRLSARKVTVEGDVSIRDSINIGPEGIFVDQGHGISVDGKVVSHGNVGLGVGNPLGKLHVGNGKFYHRTSLSSAKSLDAIPYAPKAIFSNSNRLYITSGDNQNISVWDVSEPNLLKEINTTSISGATFPGNIVVVGETAYYAKTANTIGITVFGRSENLSTTLFLDSSASIYQIIASNKYIYVSSNGTGGYSLYIIDVSDPLSPQKVGQWRSNPNPSSTVNIRFMHKVNDTIWLIGDSLLFNRVKYSIDVSNVYEPKTKSSTLGSGSTFFCGYSVDDNNVFLATGSTIIKTAFTENTELSYLSQSFVNTTGNVLGFELLGNTLYVAGDNGISVWDIENLTSPLYTSNIASAKSLYCLSVSNRNLFIINNQDDLVYFDLGNYEATSSRIGVLETDFMTTDFEMIARDISTKGLVVSEVLNKTNLGALSFSDLTVLEKISVNTEKVDNDYNVNINKGDIRHQSASLYDKVEKTISQLSLSTIDFRYHDGFVYSLSSSSSLNAIYVICVSSKDSPELINTINLGPSSSYQVSCFCFDGIYCYVFFSDGKLSIVDISHPAAHEIILSREDIGSSTLFKDCYARGKNLYGISNNNLYEINIADPKNPVLMNIIDTENNPVFLCPSNHELYIQFSDGSGQIYDISQGTPLITDEECDFEEIPVKIRTYGDIVFCLFNDSGNSKIKGWRRNPNNYFTASPSVSLGIPKDFVVYENGYVVLTETELSILVSDYGFSSSSPKVHDQITLSQGAYLGDLILSLSKNRLYMINTINSKLFSYDIGQLRTPVAQVETFSAFNAEIKELHSEGTLNAHSMMIGPGGLSVASSTGIRVDGDILIAGKTSFGSEPNSNNALTLTNGNLSLVKKESLISKTLDIDGPTNILGVVYKGPYIFVFTSANGIVCYRSENYEEQVLIGDIGGIQTSDFKDAQIVGNYLYFINGDTFNSTLYIVDISIPENMKIVSSRSWSFSLEEDLQFYNMSKLLVVGNIIFVVSQEQKNNIIVLDISDKKNIKYVKTINQNINDIVDMCTNGDKVFAISQSDKLIHWISLDTILYDNYFVPSRISEDNILTNPSRCKVYDNLLFVLNTGISNSSIDVFETVGETQSEENGLDVFEGGDIIAQIELGPNVKDFVIGSEELITSGPTISYYHLLRDYTSYLVGSSDVLDASNIDIYKNQTRMYQQSVPNIKIYSQDSFKNLSVISCSSSIGDTIVRKHANIGFSATAYSSINIGGFGFSTEGDVVVGRDFFGQGLGVGSFSKPVDIYLKNKSFIIEKNKTPNPYSYPDIEFIVQVISSDDFYAPPSPDDFQGASSDSGPEQPIDIMNGPKACKRVGNYLYVVSNDEENGNDGSLCVIDISNPKSPIFSGGVQDFVIEDCFALDVQGSFVYIATPTTISIWNVNRKENMSLVTSFTSASFSDEDFPFDTEEKSVLSDIKDIVVSGNYLFVCGNDKNFLVVFDISDTTNIRIVAAANIQELNISGESLEADSMIVEGNKLCLAFQGRDSYCAIFDITQIDRTPSLGFIGYFGNQDTISSVEAIASTSSFFYSADLDLQRIYVSEIVNGIPKSLSYHDIDINFSLIKMKSKDNYLYVMTENTFKIYKNIEGSLVLWASYDSDQNPDGIGSWTDFELIGHYVYITDEEYNRVFVVDIGGLIVDYFKTGYFESSEMSVQQGLRGNGSLFLDGNVFVGASVSSHGVISTSIIQAEEISQKNQSLSSSKLSFKGSIDVGESKERIPSERIFEQTSMADTIGGVQKCIINGDIAYVLKSNKLYAIDLSSEEPGFIGEIKKDGISFFAKDFNIVNNELFIIEFDATWLFSHYNMPNKYSDIKSSNLITKIEIAAQDQGQFFDSRINFWGQYAVSICSYEDNSFAAYIYDSFSREIIKSINIGNYPSNNIVDSAIKNGVIFYVFNSVIRYIDLTCLPDTNSVSFGDLITINGLDVTGMVIKEDWMYVSIASGDENNGIIMVYKIQRTNIPTLVLHKTRAFDGSSGVNSLIACPDPHSIAIVGDTLFISTLSSKVSETNEGDYSNGLCAFRIDNHGDFDFLYKINDIKETGFPFKVNSAENLLIINYFDNPTYSVYLLKPCTAKTMGARFHTLNADTIRTEGYIQVTGNSSVGSLNSKGDIFTRGQATSSWGFSGQIYGFRSLNSSVEINADQTFNFEDITGVTYFQKIAGIKKSLGSPRGIAWNSNFWSVTRSGKYELIFSGAINHDTTDSEVILDFNGEDSLTVLIEANKYTPVTASYVFEVNIDESTTSRNIQFGIYISDGSGVENFRVAKGSTLLLKKIS